MGIDRLLDNIRNEGYKNINREVQDLAIGLIADNGLKFNKDAAKLLLFSMTSQKRVDDIVRCINKIYDEIITNEDNLSEEDKNNIYNGYYYISINPLIKNKIRHLDYSKIKGYGNKGVTMNDEFTLISGKCCELSKQMLDLTIKIDRLECDKRQPLELFELKDQYKKVCDEYKICSKKQTDMISSICSFD
ncbi:Hypothetical protein ORPV_397 [Orpheovirus IHUMI-LCC2]|uniref:Uncharacterized protein n=1 Tax=Orpheovirus IHUMI-LCC2 TaxID=2023057 RepID=A0A2I2L462_9VIRU|nr:Hypothetical protein ORPV_397 [Orpheovirus IHUMI-LCC2]SNW62301.1 Hypothetical protein ORPV_397 [Orpheovirus IHUMI-LCC2]